MANKKTTGAPTQRISRISDSKRFEPKRFEPKVPMRKVGAHEPKTSRQPKPY